MFADSADDLMLTNVKFELSNTNVQFPLFVQLLSFDIGISAVETRSQ